MNKQQIATSYIQVRKIKPTRFSISGYLPFNNNISIPYESSLERDFLLYFTYISNVEEIVAQPTVIPFKKNNITY